MKKIREFESVIYAGTLVCRVNDINTARTCYTYDNSFAVQIAPDKTKKDSLDQTNYHELLSYLLLLGIKESQVSDEFDNHTYNITLDKSMNYGIIGIMDQVKKCSVVEKMYSDLEPFILTPLAEDYLSSFYFFEHNCQVMASE